MTTDEKEYPRTSAAALHYVLDKFVQVHGSYGIDVTPSIWQIWEEVLEAKRDTLEFVELHAEISALLVNALIEIESVKPSNVAQRLRRNATQWWNLVVYPRGDWAELLPYEALNEGAIELLGTAAGLVTADSGDSLTTPAAADLQALRESCDAWLTLLSTDDGIRGADLRKVLRNQIEHLIWLIDNADYLGLAQVVRQGDAVTGVLVRAAQQEEGPKSGPLLRTKVAAFVTALAAVAGLIHNSGIVYDAADHTLTQAEKVVKELTDSSHAAHDEGSNSK
jgi:hypothetical protein